MDLKAKKSFLINFSFACITALIVYISGRVLLKYLFPFVLAFIIAWLVQRPAEFVSVKLKINTGTIAAITAVVFYIATVTALLFIIYRFLIVAKALFEDTPYLLNSITNFVNKLKSNLTLALSEISPKVADQINLLIADMLESIRKNITNLFSNFTTKLARNTPEFLFSSIVALVAGCYIAKDFKNLLKFLRGIFGERVYSNTLRIKEILLNSVFKMIKGYFILMLITYAELTVGFFMLGLKYAPLLALAISFIDLLPVIGTGTVIIPWAVIEFFANQKTQGTILILIYITVTVVRNFLEPKIISNQIGINPLFTLVAMFLGLKLIGFWGIIIFPVTLIVIIKYYKQEIEKEKADI